MKGNRSSASRTEARSHWDKPSRTRPAENPVSNSSARGSTDRPAGSERLDVLAEIAAKPAVYDARRDGVDVVPIPVVQRLEVLEAVANGKPAAYDPRGEGHKAKAERAHVAVRARAEKRRARMNSKAEDEVAIKQAKRYLRQVWEQETAVAFGRGYPSFGPPEYAQIESLLENYTEAQLALAIAYTVQQWHAIRKRILKNESDKLSLSFVWRFHATLIPEGDDYQKIQAVHQEWQEWFKKNPSKLPPRDLSDRHRAIEPQLKALGLS